MRSRDPISPEKVKGEEEERRLGQRVSHPGPQVAAFTRGSLALRTL